MCAQSFQLCPTLCDPMDSSRAGSSVHGILQARMLECVSRPSFQGIFPTLGSNLSLPLWRQILCLLSHLSSVQLLSRVQLFSTPWTVAHQALLSMGFSKQEYWSRLPCPPSGDLPDPGIEPGSPTLQVDSLLFGQGYPVIPGLGTTIAEAVLERYRPGQSTHTIHSQVQWAQPPGIARHR